MTSSEPFSSAVFHRFVLAEYERMVRAVALVSGDVGAAEDAVQEALARAWERSGQGERIDSLGKWTVTVALNLARDGTRRFQMQRGYLSKLIERGDTDPTDRAFIIDLRRALATLPRRQREATVLHYYLGYPVAEIALALGVSEGTVKTAMHRARTRLASTLAEPVETTESSP